MGPKAIYFDRRSTTKSIRFFGVRTFKKLTKTSIHFRLADFGIKKSGLWAGKGRGMFDEGFWKAIFSFYKIA